MGQDKALLPWGGGTFLSSAIEALQPFTELVIVVAGENEANLAPIIYAHAAYLIRNPSPEDGQFSSLRIGLEAVLNRGRDAAMVTLVDRPAPSLQTIEQLKNEYLNTSDQIWAVVPEFNRKHGHPIVIGREMIEAFLRAPAASTARDVEHAHQSNIRYVGVADPVVVANINTPQDFEQLHIGQTS